MVQLMNRRELELMNRQTLRLPLALAEKDYMLAIVLKIIFQSNLINKIIFKGGTAIHHCYLSQSRFSEDLDFNSTDQSISFEEVKKVLKSENFLEIKKSYTSKATIKIERLKYDGPLGLPNSLKVEIDFIQNTILPGIEIDYRNVWGISTKVKVMDVKEIAAEKIRAMNDRARYRDFYDLFLLFDQYKFDLIELIELIKQKEIRKPINQFSIKQNWQIAQQEIAPGSSLPFYGIHIKNERIEDLISKFDFDIE